MADRADYLARTIVGRLRALETILREDLPPNDPRAETRRYETVAKILAVDAGVTDGSTVHTVLSAVPTLRFGQEVSSREMDEFAAFLRRKLPEF